MRLYNDIAQCTCTLHPYYEDENQCWIKLLEALRHILMAPKKLILSFDAIPIFSLKDLILPFNEFITIFYSLEKWASSTVVIFVTK